MDQVLVAEADILKSCIAGAETEAAKSRYQILEKAFLERFGSKPELFARSPGKDNVALLMLKLLEGPQAA